jgi:hypothetical protein
MGRVRCPEWLVDPAAMLVSPAFFVGATCTTPLVATPRPANLDVASATNLDIPTLDGRPSDRGLPITSGGAGP